MLRRRRATLALVIWTLLVWSTRFNLIWSDAELSTAGKLGRSALAASFTVLAIAVAITLWRRSRPAWATLSTDPAAPTTGSTAAARAVGVLAAWTTVVWLVRGTGIVVDDHSVGFTVVHTALAVVSVTLAALAWREISGRRPVSLRTRETAGT